MKLAVLGATGMLGSVTLRLLAESGHDVVGVVRSPDAARLLPPQVAERVHGGLEATYMESLVDTFDRHRPDVVINCIGLVKQLENANRVLEAIPINTLLPHRLAQLCALGGARLIHISTDCVFTGSTGNYREEDAPDATDLYGTSKRWGEIADVPHAITLRTSIIGPELRSAHGLLAWFLAQAGSVKGFRKAIFSGLPTVELARVIRDLVLPRPELNGLYHVSAAPIAKYDLLHLFANEYGRTVTIEPSDSLTIDRSLDSSRFRSETGYSPPDWPHLVAEMRRFG
jgi:dTDP-4-dehydrorhamnose reductase